MGWRLFHLAGASTSLRKDAPEAVLVVDRAVIDPLRAVASPKPPRADDRDDPNPPPPSSARSRAAMRSTRAARCASRVARSAVARTVPPAEDRAEEDAELFLLLGRPTAREEPPAPSSLLYTCFKKLRSWAVVPGLSGTTLSA